MEEAAGKWLDRYLGSLRERHLSPHTLTNYRRDLLRLQDYCDAQQLTTWQAINAAGVRRYVAWRHRQGIGGRSLQRELSSMRGFFNFLLEQGVLDSNPANDIPAPRSEKRLPNALDVDKTARLVALQGDETLVLRDRALMELIYSSGLRLAEVASLNLDSIDRQKGSVRVVGKGRKERIVPVGNEALQALARWLKVRSELASGGETALFVSQRGSRLSPRSMQQRIREWGVRQGLDTRVHPHMLRHSFASHILESSGDLRAVQELLGHADIATTQIYTHLDFQHLAKIYDKSHPRARRRRED